MILSLMPASVCIQLDGGGGVQVDAVPAPDVPVKILEFKYKTAKTHEEKRRAAQEISDLLEVRLLQRGYDCHGM